MLAGDNQFIRRLLIIAAIGAIFLLLWNISSIVLLIFAASLIAIIFHSISDPIQRHTGLSQRWSLVAAIFIIIAVFGLASWLFGNMIGHQISSLGERIPSAWEALKERLATTDYGQEILKQTATIKGGGLAPTVASGLSMAAFSLFDSLANFIIALVGGIFIAAQPKLYINGFLQLIPAGTRPRIAEALQLSGKALKLWFVGKLISMLCIGVLISVMLLIIGVPSSIALGLLAGLGEFVPYVGNLTAIFPALLLAVQQDTGMVLWVLAGYIAVQQFQGNVIMPLVQQRMLELPPALTIFSLAIFTLLFGFIGLLLAEPLTVFFFVMVKKLYVRDILGEATQIPGESMPVKLSA